MTNPSRFLRAAALAANFLLAAGCSDDGSGNDDDDDDNGVGPTANIRVTAVLDGGGGAVTVTDGGVAMTSGAVELNGTAAVPGTTPGEYRVTLPVRVAAGEVLTLEVRDGESVVRGTATMPEAAVITGPDEAASFDPADRFQVTWTSATNPRRFVVEAVGPSTMTFPVAGGGTAREATVAPTTLGYGQWTLRVQAYNRGALTGHLELGSSMEIRADAASTTAIIVEPHLLIEGDEMGREIQSIRLLLGGTAVDGATVTVNGEVATQAAPGGPYAVSLAAPVAVGDALDLSVTVGHDVYAASDRVPAAPVITAVRGTFTSADPIRVEWTAPANPDRFAISAWECWKANPRRFESPEIAGNQRSYTFPAFPEGDAFRRGEYFIMVTSYTDGDFSGPVHPFSRMSIRGGDDLAVIGYC